MSPHTVEMIRNAEIGNNTPKLSITNQKAMDNLRAYVELMAQQKKPLTTIKVNRGFLSDLMKALNNGREVEDRYSGATFKGVPLEAV
jgi:hypothetical protein